MIVKFNKMDDTNEATWVNLKILSKLQPFEKLGTRKKHFEINPSHTLQEAWFRWWNGASRESDFDRIKDLYKDAYKLKEEQPERTKAHIFDSVKGLQSLQKTYEKDITMKARIDCLIDDVNKAIQ